MVLVVLLPTLLAAYTQRNGSPGAHAQRQQEEGEAEEGGPGLPAAWPGTRKVVAGAAKLCGQLDGWLRYLCLLPGWDPMQRALSLLLMLGNMWLVARIVGSDAHTPAAAAAATTAPPQPKGGGLHWAVP